MVSLASQIGFSAARLTKWKYNCPCKCHGNYMCIYPRNMLRMTEIIWNCERIGPFDVNGHIAIHPMAVAAMSSFSLMGYRDGRASSLVIVTMRSCLREHDQTQKEGSKNN
jgi:hypothetical protein